MLINIDKLLFAFVFMLGLLMKLFFLRKYTFAEFLAVSFYLLGAYTLFTILNLFYVAYLNSTLQFLHILLMTLYFIYAMTSFFQKRKLVVGIKSAILFPLAFLSYVILAFGTSYLVIWLKQ